MSQHGRIRINNFVIHPTIVSLFRESPHGFVREDISSYFCKLMIIASHFVFFEILVRLYVLRRGNQKINPRERAIPADAAMMRSHLCRDAAGGRLHRRGHASLAYAYTGHRTSFGSLGGDGRL